MEFPIPSLELEAIVDGEHPEDGCLRACEQLLVRLRIDPADRTAVAFIDLLTGR